MGKYWIEDTGGKYNRFVLVVVRPDLEGIFGYGTREQAQEALQRWEQRDLEAAEHSDAMRAATFDIVGSLGVA